MNFLLREELPFHQKQAYKIALQSSPFYLDPKLTHQKRVVVLRHLQEQILKAPVDTSQVGGCMVRWFIGGGGKGMYSDSVCFARNFLLYAIVSGGGRVNHSPFRGLSEYRCDGLTQDH